MLFFPCGGTLNLKKLKGKPLGRLSPKIQVWLENYNQTMENLRAEGFKPTPENTRKGLDELTRSLVTDGPIIPWIRDDHVDAPHRSIPVRIYHPKPDVKRPVLVYYHGGGHMAGSIAVYDLICRKLAKAADHIVVSVDYRLAPEHPYPAGVEDAYVVAISVWETLDRNNLEYLKQLSIAGDSGGGALCATVAHKSQYESRLHIQHQILIYPSLDYTMASPSIDINGTGYLLEKSKIQWYFDHYFQHHEDRRKASPLYMATTAQLPETLVITAGFDPLCDEGAAYVEIIQSKGVVVKHLHFENMIHAFINMENLAKETCRSVYQAIGTFLKT